MDYYDEIKQKLIDNEIYERIKDYSKERNRVITYYEIGRLLNEAGKSYGENIIGEYSKKLVKDVGKKYDKSTLYKMRRFYILFENQKVAPLVPKLSWSHYLILLPLNDVNKINYYVNQVICRKLSKRQLQEIIKNNEYERLSDDTKNKLVLNEETCVIDFVKNPILIKNSYNYDDISEKILKRLILEDMDNFLEELGEGFCYIKNEYKIKIGDRFNYIDILLFNIKFNCYCVLELKVTELKTEYIGQIKKYMNYIDKNVRTIGQDNTIGIIICKKDNRFIMEYCSDERVYRTTYILN